MRTYFIPAFLFNLLGLDILEYYLNDSKRNQKRVDIRDTLASCCFEKS